MLIEKNSCFSFYLFLGFEGDVAKECRSAGMHQMATDVSHMIAQNDDVNAQNQDGVTLVSSFDITLIFGHCLNFKPLISQHLGKGFAVLLDEHPTVCL